MWHVHKLSPRQYAIDTDNLFGEVLHGKPGSSPFTFHCGDALVAAGIDLPDHPSFVAAAARTAREWEARARGGAGSPYEFGARPGKDRSVSAKTAAQADGDASSHQGACAQEAGCRVPASHARLRFEWRELAPPSARRADDKQLTLAN